MAVSQINQLPCHEAVAPCTKNFAPPSLARDGAKPAWSCVFGLHSCVGGFAGADADNFLDRHHKNLAVTDFARSGSLDDRVHGVVNLVLTQDDFNFDLWQKIHGVFAPAVNLGLALLASKALHFRHL